MNAVRTAERLDRDRFRLSVVCLQQEGPLARRYDAAGIPIVYFSIGSLYSLRTMREMVRLASYLRSEGVDLVHCHDRYTDFFGVLAARMAGTRGIIASKRWSESRLRHRATSAIGFRFAHRVLANSPSVAASLRDEDHISPNRVVVIPNFVDEDAFAAPPPGWREALSRELELASDSRIVGIVASLRAVKDHESLLRAIALLRPRWPSLRLVIVGEGDRLHELQRLGAELGISHMVRFAGLRPHAPSMQHLFEISVLCSRSEGFPNSVVEAMAAGRPVVATNVVGIRDAVRPNETGLLVPAADPAALAGAIEALLADPALGRSMGEAGRQWAAAEFHAGRVIASVEALYESLLTQ